MRVVLDTNVIIAAFATRGLCAEVFEICLLNHTIIMSEEILQEVSDKLQEKIHLPAPIIKGIINYLKETAEIVKPLSINRAICRDINDLMIIGTALKGKARFIITGDEDLLSLKSYEGINIITPREFWRILKENS